MNLAESPARSHSSLTAHRNIQGKKLCCSCCIQIRQDNHTNLSVFIPEDWRRHDDMICVRTTYSSSKLWPRHKWCHSDLDLWPSKSSQFILESQWTLVQSLKRIPQSVLEILHSQETWAYVFTYVRTFGPATAGTEAFKKKINKKFMAYTVNYWLSKQGSNVTQHQKQSWWWGYVERDVYSWKSHDFIWFWFMGLWFHLKVDCLIHNWFWIKWIIELFPVSCCRIHRFPEVTAVLHGHTWRLR